MPRNLLSSVLPVALAAALAAPAGAQSPGTAGSVGTMPLPGGLSAARAAAGDHTSAGRAEFLVDVIRRVHNAPPATRYPQAEATLASLLTHLASAPGGAAAPRPPVSTATGRNGSPPIPAAASDTVPLPLSPDLWIDVVFGGRATIDSLAAEILRSRSASLLYTGLLSLDGPTRAWLADDRDLIREIAVCCAATFAMAAPALRVAGGAIVVPGGPDAAPGWEALTGRRATDPAAFVRALLTTGQGHAAYFYSAMAPLTVPQLRFGLSLDAPSAERIEVMRRLYAVFVRVAGTWTIEERAFWRPGLDPALLLSDLRTDTDGRPVLPGTQPFWEAVLASGGPDPSSGRGPAADVLAGGDPVAFAWLCDRVFVGSQILVRGPYNTVLFASRRLDTIPLGLARDAADTLRASHTMPILVTTLERAGLTDVRAFGAAARRATRLAAIGDEDRAARALAQFQGALALTTRAVRYGGIAPESLPGLVSSLAAVDLNERGEYEGRVVRWLATLLDAQGEADPRPDPLDSVSFEAPFADAVGPMDVQALRMMAGYRGARGPLVEWEGARYRLDFAWADVVRLAGLLRETPPYLSSARVLIEAADALDAAAASPDALRTQAALLEQVVQAGSWDADILAALQRATRAAAARSGRRDGASLRALADDLLTRGLITLVYASALGQPEQLLISAEEAASRHEFGLRAPRSSRTVVWQPPVAGTERLQAWRVVGALLGLDVTLADFALLRLSAKPPPRRPTLNEADRRALIEGVVLVEPALLTDDQRDTIADAMRKGRDRIGGVPSPDQAEEAISQLPLSPLRRTLLAWTLAFDAARTAAFPSPLELVWLGLEGQAAPGALHAWGAPAEARIGCLCLRLPDPARLERLQGRWDTGMLASGFADLHLRLAELLADLGMPAPLLAGVTAAAVLDLVNSAASRDYDDRRALVDFAEGLSRERLEQYLALLTTDGPLVPVEDGALSGGRAAGRAAPEDRP